MSHLCISTRGVCSWRDRLANPDRQWKRKYSALETAASWERAAGTECGLPDAIAKVLQCGGFASPVLMLAVAEHKVELPGGDAASQCDVWGIVRTDAGLLSLSVEAKAKEPFGDATLGDWLAAGSSNRSVDNRRRRWEFIRAHLPDGEFGAVPYQLLHRCAAAVIEARRFGFWQAAFVVQAFETPDDTFGEYQNFCTAVGLPASRDGMARTSVVLSSLGSSEKQEVALGIGWADCTFGDDSQLAAIV